MRKKFPEEFCVDLNPAIFLHQNFLELIFTFLTLLEASIVTELSFLFLIFSLFFLPFQGFGMLLMEEAERIAKEEHGARKIAVISGTAAFIPWDCFF